MCHRPIHPPDYPRLFTLTRTLLTCETAGFAVSFALALQGSDKPLDADSLLPLLVHSLAQANLPRVHEALNFLRKFQGAGWGGEQEYYVTCL